MLRDLKIGTKDLDAVLNGRATVETAEGVDDIEVDDLLRLREWDPQAGRYLEREHVVLVTKVEERGGSGAVLTVRDDPPEQEGPVS